MRTFLSVLLIVSAATLGAAAGDSHATPKPPTDFPWERSTPEAQGLDSEVLLAGLQRIRDEEIDVHSLIIIRHGHVVLESYVHPYDRKTLHNVKSVSKSIISAVTGVALERGVLDDLDRPVYEFFPEYLDDDDDPLKRRITLRHLLTMTSGLDLDENAPIMYGIFGSEDWIGATLARPMVADPGTRFLYSTPLTHTMSGVLSRTSGKSLLELTREYLFEPLGIDHVQWKTGPRGYYFGGAELFLTPRDLANFGMLYLAGGRWNGKQIVPAEWVESSTRNRLPAAIEDQLYGYWWWIKPDGGYFASGWNGQAVLVDPAAELVIVTTGADPKGVDTLFRGFEDYEPSDEPLPPNPRAAEALIALVKELAAPTPMTEPELPEVAAAVSGRTYRFEENPLGFEELSLEFDGGKGCRLSIVVKDKSFDSEVGLDGRYRFTETGDLGPMPENNRIAVRGAWVDDATFAIDAHEMGDPIHSRTLFTFSGDTIDVAVSVRPIGRNIHFRGEWIPRAAKTDSN
jgi:CubicO group peptidase (beta-lactamase class C family)